MKKNPKLNFKSLGNGLFFLSMGLQIQGGKIYKYVSMWGFKKVYETKCSIFFEKGWCSVLKFRKKTFGFSLNEAMANTNFPYNVTYI